MTNTTHREACNINEMEKCDVGHGKRNALVTVGSVIFDTETGVIRETVDKRKKFDKQQIARASLSRVIGKTEITLAQRTDTSLLIKSRESCFGNKKNSK